MFTTTVLFLAFVGELVTEIVLWFILLRLGAHWAKIPGQ